MASDWQCPDFIGRAELLLGLAAQQHRPTFYIFQETS